MDTTNKNHQDAQNDNITETEESTTDNAEWGPTIKGEGMASAGKRFSPQVAGDQGAGTVGMATVKKNWRAKW